jgi:hypothetical protein
MKAARPLCLDCRHLRGYDREMRANTCAAFPGGIPRSIVEGDIVHTEPVAGDGGIRFESAR